MNHNEKDHTKSEELLTSKQKWKNRLKQLLKILVSATALYLVFSNISLNEVLEVYQASTIWLLFVALVLFVFSKLIAAYRLNCFFYSADVSLSQAQNIRLYMLGMFYNLFLPGGIGGDGYKVYYLKKNFQASTRNMIAAVALDRLSGLAALMIIAAIMLQFLNFQYDQFSWLILLIALPAYFLGRWLVRRFFVLFLSIYHKVIGLSLLVQGIQVLCALALLVAFGQKDLLLSYLFLFLLSSLAAAIPFTIGGAGARELTFLYGAQLFGIDIAVAIALSLSFYLITMTVSLSGLYFVIRPGSLRIT